MGNKIDYELIENYIKKFQTSNHSQQVIVYSSAFANHMKLYNAVLDLGNASDNFAITWAVKEIIKTTTDISKNALECQYPSLNLNDLDANEELFDLAHPHNIETTMQTFSDNEHYRKMLMSVPKYSRDVQITDGMSDEEKQRQYRKLAANILFEGFKLFTHKVDRTKEIKNTAKNAAELTIAKRGWVFPQNTIKVVVVDLTSTGSSADQTARFVDTKTNKILPATNYYVVNPNEFDKRIKIQNGSPLKIGDKKHSVSNVFCIMALIDEGKKYSLSKPYYILHNTDTKLK